MQFYARGYKLKHFFLNTTVKPTKNKCHTLVFGQNLYGTAHRDLKLQTTPHDIALNSNYNCTYTTLGILVNLLFLVNVWRTGRHFMCYHR